MRPHILAVVIVLCCAQRASAQHHHHLGNYSQPMVPQSNSCVYFGPGYSGFYFGNGHQTFYSGGNGSGMILSSPGFVQVFPSAPAPVSPYYRRPSYYGRSWR